MASKVTLNDIATLTNQSAISVLNLNNTTIEEAFDNTLSRDGTAPNQMEADLDMNSQRILNLLEAVAGTEPVRKTEFDELEDRVDDVEVSIGAIDTQLGAALAAVADAEALVEAAEALDDYYVSIWNPEMIESSERLLDHVFATTVIFPANMTASRAECRTGATLATILSIRKNDVEFSTITFDISANTGTFSSSSETTFVAGDNLSIIGPATVDATLAGIALSLVGSRT